MTSHFAPVSVWISGREEKKPPSCCSLSVSAPFLHAGRCRAVLPGFPCCQTAVMGGLVQNELFSLSPFTWQEELSVRLGAAPMPPIAAPCSTQPAAEPGASLPAPLTASNGRPVASCLISL